MIECGDCEKWFHTDCFNLSKEDNIDDDDFVFTCPDCFHKKPKKANKGKKIPQPRAPDGKFSEVEK